MTKQLREMRLRMIEEGHPGVVVEPITWLHRHEDGIISFMRYDPETRDVRPFASVTAAELRSQPFLPSLVEHCSIDGFVSMNAFFRKGTRRSGDLRYLNAAFVDLDFYEKDAEGKILRTLNWYDAIALMLRLGDEGTIPPPSIYVRSGNGAWLLWLIAKEDGSPETAFLDQREWLKRIQKAARESIYRTAASLNPDAHAADLSRVLRIPGSFSTKAARQVVWLGAFESDGSLPTYTLAELGDFFGEQKRPPVPQRNVRHEAKPSEQKFPRRNAGRRAVSEQRLNDLRSLSTHRGGFSEGCRNDAMLALACMMAKLGTPHEELRRELEREAERCRPRLSAEEVEKAFHSATTGRYRWRNSTLVEKLGVTEFEAWELEAEGTPLRQILPGFVAKATGLRQKADDRRAERSARRELLRREWRETIDATGKHPPLRDLARWVESRGFSASHETIRADLRALGLHGSQIPSRQRILLHVAECKGEPN